jgi:hypothetical protein
MKPKFEIEIKSFKTIHSLPESWTKKDLLKILELSDFDADDTCSETDLYDYLSMAFDDIEPEVAAEIVLTYVFGNRLNKNQISEIALEMQEENLWEEYGDMSLHEELFKVTSLLYHAYNGKFPHPDAADVVVHIKAINHDGEVALKTLDEVLISRVLAKGMTEHAVIYRLFQDNIEGGDWPEAKDIIWQFKAEEIDTKNVEIELTTAIYWVKELKGISEYVTELISA